MRALGKSLLAFSMHVVNNGGPERPRTGEIRCLLEL